MTHNGEALSRLRGIRLDQLTSAEMSSVLGTTTLTPATTDALVQAAIVSQGLSAQRTYANGNLPIPEQSAIFSQDTAALGTIAIKPTGSEIWVVKAMIGYGFGGAAQSVMKYVTDTGEVRMNGPTTIAAAPTGTMYDLNDQAVAPHELTSSMWLEVEETGGVYGLAVAVAYTVVSQ